LFFSGVPAVKGLNFCATDSCGSKLAIEWRKGAHTFDCLGIRYLT
jgi:hypothetical protein